MTRIESEKGDLKTNPKAVYEDLSDLNNLKKYLPTDKISDWQSDGHTCSFKVMGTYVIGLKFSEESTEEHIKLVATDKSPFPFTINLHVIPQEANNSTAQIICDAELNMMLKMMVVKPLKSLFDYIIKKADAYYS